MRQDLFYTVSGKVNSCPHAAADREDLAGSNGLRLCSRYGGHRALRWFRAVYAKTVRDSVVSPMLIALEAGDNAVSWWAWRAVCQLLTVVQRLVWAMGSADCGCYSLFGNGLEGC